MVFRPSPNSGERRNPKNANREMTKPMEVAIKEELEPGNVAWVFPVRQKCGGRPEALRRKQNRRAKGLTSKEMSYISADRRKRRKNRFRVPPKVLRLKGGPIL